MQIATIANAPRAQVKSFMISEEVVALVSLLCPCLDLRTMKALENRDAEREGQCGYAGRDKIIPQINLRPH